MNTARWVLSGVLALALPGLANAQIYESEDAEGVPEFSDTPTPGAEKVELQQTNIADDPPDIPEAPPEAAAQSRTAAGAQGQASGQVGEPAYDVVDPYYDNDHVREQRRIDRDRVDNALPGGGVGNPGVGVEPPPAEGEAARQEAPGGQVGGHPGGRR